MNRFAKQLLPFCSLIFIISLCTFLEPDNFLSARNLVNVLCRSSINGIMAAGMTYIIITGGIDLSVGSMLAVCGMIGAASMLYFSGGTWVSIFRGISYIMNAGKPFAVSDYSWLDTGRVAGIPSSVILLVIVMVAFWFLLKHTRFGRYTYAIGSNVQTAFHAGINVNKTLVWIYTLTGALVGLASMITVARASTAQPTAGISLELDIVAACIIGGCAPSGGRGTMMGTVIGTLLISFLRNGLTLLDISTNVQLVVIGLIIIVAVTADQIATRRKAT